QINFIKQALAVDPQFFVKYPMTTLVSVDELNALGSQYPEGMHAYMRAPFFALQNNNAKLTDFISRYRAQFNGEYPSDWSGMVNEIKGNQCDAKAGDPTTANFALCPSWKAS